MLIILEDYEKSCLATIGSFPNYCLYRFREFVHKSIILLRQLAAQGIKLHYLPIYDSNTA
jgi:hypothetical protein